jgi:hypothetical protein
MNQVKQICGYPFGIGAILFLIPPAFAAPTSADSVNRPARTLQCGEIVDDNLTMQADLVCPGFAGKVLTLKGTRHVLNGNGHRIIAPNAQVGVWIEGSWNEVRDLEVSGLNHGVAISAADTPYLEIRRSIFNDNQVGIRLEATRTEMQGIWIHDNQVRHSSQFGILASQSARGHIRLPQFWQNDLSQSRRQAFHLEVSSARLSLHDHNVTDGASEPNVLPN